jgi:hypothetical protein
MMIPSVDLLFYSGPLAADRGLNIALHVLDAAWQQAGRRLGTLGRYCYLCRYRHKSQRRQASSSSQPLSRPPGSEPRGSTTQPRRGKISGVAPAAQGMMRAGSLVGAGRRGGRFSARAACRSRPERPEMRRAWQRLAGATTQLHTFYSTSMRRPNWEDKCRWLPATRRTGHRPQARDSAHACLDPRHERVTSRPCRFWGTFAKRHGSHKHDHSGPARYV